MVAKKVEAAFDPADEGLVRNSTEEICCRCSRPLLADFVAEVGDGKNEVTVSTSLSRLLRPLYLAAGPLRQ